MMEPPAFSRPLRDCSVQEGSDFTLEGHVTGTPPISVSWQHNGEPLRFGKSSFHDGVARLVVDECLPEDAGVYTCMLANCAGKTSSTAAVMVKDLCKFPKSKDSHVSRVMVSSRVTSVSSSSMVSRITVGPNNTPELEKGAVTMLFEVLPQHGITKEVCIKGPWVSGTASHSYVTDREKTRNSHNSRRTPPETLHATEAINARATSGYHDISDNSVSTPSPSVTSSNPTQGIGKTFKTTRSEIIMVDNHRPMEKPVKVLSQIAEERPKYYSTVGDSEKEAPGNPVSSAKLIPEKESNHNGLHSERTLAANIWVTPKSERFLTQPASTHSWVTSNAGIAEKEATVIIPSSDSAIRVARKVETPSASHIDTMPARQHRAIVKKGETTSSAASRQSPESTNTGISETNGGVSRSTHGRAKKQHVLLLETTGAPKDGLQEIKARIPTSLDDIHLQNGSHACVSKKDGPSQNTVTKDNGSTRNAFVSMKTTAGTVYPKKATEHTSTVPEKVHSPDDTEGGIAKSDVSIYRSSPFSASTTLDSGSTSNTSTVPEEVHSPDDAEATERESTVKATTTNVGPAGTDCRIRAVEHTTPVPEEVHSPEHASDGVSEDYSSMYLPSPVSASTSPDSVTPKRRALKSGDSLKLLDPVTSVEVKAGDQAELFCEILGSPPIAASWVKQKKQISDGAKTSVETTDTGSKLVIREVQADDSGCYILYVRDRTGSIQHQISLSVTDRPQPPAGKPYASALLADSLTLSWSGPCYDGGSAIQSYVVEVKEVGEVTWCTLTDSCLSTSYRVKGGLKPNQEYQFRVRAVNAHGASDPGEESAVIKMSLEEDASSTETFEYQQVVINTTEKVKDLYDQLERLGVGKFGQVYRLQEKATGKILAGKFYKTRLAKDRESARMEVELMNKLHHPKLAQCVAAYQARTEMVMVLEYIAGGELFERIVDDAFEHTEPTCVQYMRQILEGVQYMHSQNIVHLDLKPENIVCVNRTGNKIKIIDFGLARTLCHGTQVKVMQGTPEFIAPEVIAFEPIGFTTDMWSIGVICYILVSGDSPFQGNNDMETLRNVTAAQWDFDEETFEEISDRAKDFIIKLLKKSMRSRLTADQALHHPWLQETEQGNTKTLSKEKIKKFLARQKWQKTGKAVLALKRMALLSNKQDNNKVSSPDSPHRDDFGLSPQDNEVFSFLHQQIQRPPSFSKPLKDQAEVEGSSACLQCHIEGYPDPEVIWFQNGIPIQECGRYRIEYNETGSCSLIISDVTQEDSGQYSCKAFNGMGEAELCAKLTVSALHADRHR
ncbi:uncharacterized protein LOC144755825 isoform X2 [Lissotriton helveticus]